MERYLAFERNEDCLSFDADALAHFSRVRRGKIGEHVEAVLDGVLYEAEITECRDRLVGRILREIPTSSELKSDFYIAFPLLRGNHHELIVQKGTELGAKGFCPYVAKRSVALCPKGKEEEKRARLEKIAENSLEQCRRLYVPSVLPIATFDGLLKAASQFDRLIIADEELAGEKATSLDEALEGLRPSEKILYLIGPEGGFEREEAAAARGAGFKPVTLGSRILRAETAAIYGASIHSAISEKL